MWGLRFQCVTAAVASENCGVQQEAVQKSGGLAGVHRLLSEHNLEPGASPGMLVCSMAWCRLNRLKESSGLQINMP